MKRQTKLIKVLLKDINKGQSSSEFCPIAKAIKRTYKKQVSVGPDMIVVHDKAFETTYTIKNFICDFDNRKKVYPISFRLSDLESRDYNA